MKSKRSHPYRITEEEAKRAWEILRGPDPMIKRLEGLLEITTGKRGTHLIGQGFRNDIKRIIDAANQSK
jgi:hypothetical protein